MKNVLITGGAGFIAHHLIFVQRSYLEPICPTVDSDQRSTLLLTVVFRVFNTQIAGLLTLLNHLRSTARKFFLEALKQGI